jgi:hypothetical protein
MTPDDPEEPEEPEGGAPTPAEGKPAAESEAERRAGSDRRASAERRVRNVPVEVERRSGIDRRSIPDRRAGRRGGEYELDADTLEFIAAIGAFKERTGKAFPTWSDMIALLRSLGWEKRPKA